MLWPERLVKYQLRPGEKSSRYFPDAGHARPDLLHVSHSDLSPEQEPSFRPEVSPETCKPEEVNRMETVLDRPENDVVLSQPLDQEAAVIDFSDC